NLSHLPISNLKGVGAKTIERLQKCGIFNIQDLLFHLPSRYQDRTHVYPIRNLRPHDYAVIEGYIEEAEVTKGRRSALLLKLRDSSGRIQIRFFHFYPSQKDQLHAGVKLRCFGEVRLGIHGLEMVHPEYQRIFSEAIVAVEETLTPIYPTTQGL